MKSRFLIMLAMFVVSAIAGCEKKQVIGEATKHLLAAKAAAEKGDNATSLKELDAAIAAGEEAYLYLERAKVKHALGDDPGAIADCEQCIKLDPDHSADAKWYIAELKKPKAKQFQGEAAEPPSAAK